MKQHKRDDANKIILLFCFISLIISLNILNVNASIENIGTVKQFDCITLPQTCNCTWNNITTIMFPDKSFIIINGAMARDGTYFNYTYCNTSVVGLYIVNGVGDKDAVITPFNYFFEVTTTGNDYPYTIPLFLGLAGFILLILAFIMKNNYIGFISGILFIVLGIYVLVYGLGVMSDFYTQSIAYVTLGFGLLIFLASSYSAINETNVNLFNNNPLSDDDDF